MKKLWNKNRVLFVLSIIIFICIVILGVSFVVSILNQHDNPYGERMIDNDKYPVDDDFKDKVISFLKENNDVKEVTINLKVRTIFVNLKLNEKISLDSAKKLVDSSVKEIDENYLDYYDLQYSLDSENYKIFGSRKAKRDGISWDNNREVEKEENDEE